MAETESNMEAVRGGYAHVRQAMHSTRNYHAIVDQQRRRYYLCGCGAPMLAFQTGHSTLAAKRRKDDRWCDGSVSLRAKILNRSTRGGASK